MAVTYNITGTSSDQFMIGKNGPQLVKNGNNLEVSTPSGTLVVDSLAVTTLDIGGTAASGVPNGGTGGSILAKASDSDGDSEWVRPESGLGGSPGSITPYGLHRYWSIRITATTGDQRYTQVADIQMRELPGSSSIAVGGTAIAGSSSSPASNAFDSVLNNFWETGDLGNVGTNELAWIGYDFNQLVSITEVQIIVSDSYETDERPLSGNIRYSDDGINWTTAWGFSGLDYGITLSPVLTSPAYSPPSGKLWLVPGGGLDGQVLKKTSDNDGEFEWVDDTVDTRYVASSFAPLVNYPDLTIFRHNFVYDVNLPSSLTGSKVDSITAATASTEYTLRKNGVSIGSFTWAAAATIPVIVFSSSQSFIAGDVLDIIGPATADTTLAGITITLLGTKL